MNGFDQNKSGLQCIRIRKKGKWRQARATDLQFGSCDPANLLTRGLLQLVMLVWPSKKMKPLNLIIKTECLYLFGCTYFMFVAVCTLCIYYCLGPVSSLMAHVYLYDYEYV